MICHSFQTLSRSYDINGVNGAVHIGVEFSEVTGSFCLPVSRKLFLRFSERDAQEEPFRNLTKGKY